MSLQRRCGWTNGRASPGADGFQLVGGRLHVELAMTIALLLASLYTHLYGIFVIVQTGTKLRPLLTENHQTSTWNDAWKLCWKAKMEILEHGSVMNLLLCPATKFRVSWQQIFLSLKMLSLIRLIKTLLCISKQSNLKIVATPPFLWICADVPSTGPSWRCPAEPITRFAAVRRDAKPPRRTARSWSYHGLCQEGVGSLGCHLRCWKWWWLHTCFLSRPISTNDKIFEVRSRYSYCILLHMYFRCYVFYLIISHQFPMRYFWTDCSVLSVGWISHPVLLVIAGWRFVECPKTLKLHRKKRKTSWGNAAGLEVFTLRAKLWVGWVVEAWLQKFHEIWYKSVGETRKMGELWWWDRDRSSPPENSSFKCSRRKVPPCW